MTITPTVDWKQFIHPTLAPSTEVKIEQSPPLLYYFVGNVLFKKIYNQSPVILWAFDQIDYVRDAVWVDGQIAILGPQGVLLFDPAGGESQTITQFDRAIRQGQLFFAPASKSLLYRGEIEDPQGAFGIGNLLGIYNIGTQANQKIPFEYKMLTSYSILGLDGDRHQLYLLPRGQDPSWGFIWIYDLDSGQLVTRDGIRGDNVDPLLSPDLDHLATILYNDQADTSLLYIYTLPQPSSTPMVFTLPDPPSHPSTLSWSPDGRAIYFLLKKGRIFDDSMPADGIWSLQVASGQMKPIFTTSENWFSWARLDSQWIILYPPVNGKSNAVNLLSGAEFDFALPVETGPIVHAN